MGESKIYLCWSCDAQYTLEEWQEENLKKKGEPRGLCKWCKDMSRNLKGAIK